MLIGPAYAHSQGTRRAGLISKTSTGGDATKAFAAQGLSTLQKLALKSSPKRKLGRSTAVGCIDQT